MSLTILQMKSRQSSKTLNHNYNSNGLTKAIQGFNFLIFPKNLLYIMSKNRFAPKNADTSSKPDMVEEIIKQQKLKEKIETSEGEIHRVNFNMPKYLYEMTREKTTKRGMTLTNYILMLIRKDLGEE